jgi:predicted phosphodiesterase
MRVAEKSNPAQLDAASRDRNARLIGWLNRLPGSELPAAIGGGSLPAPRGVIHAGDLIDTGDKNGGPHEAMQRTEFAAFAADFGLNGGDGQLRLPVREVHGNHDSPRGEGFVMEQLRERTKARTGLANVSPNGVHYSWDWDGVHFINLGIVVGPAKTFEAPRRYAPLDSLGFLTSDLASQVGNSGRPVVITHHVDVARYCGPGPSAPEARMEWRPEDCRAYFEALRGYRVAAILYGHTHARRVFPWDGTPPAATPPARGIAVFNTDNAAHFKSEEQAFLHLQVSANEAVAREFATTDGWNTGEWTPQVWRLPVA